MDLCPRYFDRIGSLLLMGIPASTHERMYIFSKEELSRLFNRLDQLEPNNYTTGYMVFPALFRTVYGCGLRISEALKLQKADVDIADGLLHIRHGKNDKERILPVSRRPLAIQGTKRKGTLAGIEIQKTAAALEPGHVLRIVFH